MAKDTTTERARSQTRTPHSQIVSHNENRDMKNRLFLIMIVSILLSCQNNSEVNKKEEEMDPQIEKSIEDFKNRKIYKKLSAEILNSISDDNLEQTVFDNIYEIIGVDYANEFTNVRKLTKGQQAVFSTWIIEGEVNNGGFNQFYFNSSGQYAEMAALGFKTIGAEKYSNLAYRANKIYNENKDRLEEFDDGTMESFSESYKDNPLNDLDTEFYKLEDIEKIGKLRIKYIRNNIAEFTTE